MTGRAPPAAPVAGRPDEPPGKLQSEGAATPRRYQFGVEIRANGRERRDAVVARKCAAGLALRELKIIAHKYDSLMPLILLPRECQRPAAVAQTRPPHPLTRYRAGSRLELQFFHFVRPARRVTHLQRGTHSDDSGGMPVEAAHSAVTSFVAAQAH